MELADLICLDATVLDFYLVPREDNWDIFANANEIAMPVGEILWVIREVMLNMMMAQSLCL